ncbi:Maf family protein [Actinobaculum sp. 313]|uniref:Maf family protein n=1 Tax=Actinobaculum sp. 313 TaxID=2495645 RepID=UPI000F737360
MAYARTLLRIARFGCVARRPAGGRVMPPALPPEDAGSVSSDPTGALHPVPTNSAPGEQSGSLPLVPALTPSLEPARIPPQSPGGLAPDRSTGGPHLSLLLASKSPARLSILRQAGIEPLVHVSHVDEESVLTGVKGGPQRQVLVLATAKARAVARQLRADRADSGQSSIEPTSIQSPVALTEGNPAGGALADGVAGHYASLPGPAVDESHSGAGALHESAESRTSGEVRASGESSASAEGDVSAAGSTSVEGSTPAAVSTNAALPDLILGCDSMFEFQGKLFGKPRNADEAREQLRAMSGQSGFLYTGHCLLRPQTVFSLSAVQESSVRFARMSDAEIDAYISTGEPLNAAGCFMIDGMGGPFVTGLHGDYHNVVGLSLSLLRNMLAELGLSVAQLWTRPGVKSVPLTPRGSEFLQDTRLFNPQQDSDGFVFCGNCRQRHWGLAGAAGLALFRRHEGRPQVLLQLRAPWSHNGGTWSIPGGALRCDETRQQGALREFAEETGIGAEHIAITTSYVIDHQDWKYTTFTAQCLDDVTPTPNNESQELRWFDVDDIPTGVPGTLHRQFAEGWQTVRGLMPQR